MLENLMLRLPHICDFSTTQVGGHSMGIFWLVKIFLGDNIDSLEKLWVIALAEFWVVNRCLRLSNNWLIN